MTALTIGDAAQRALVRLPDGQTGRLVGLTKNTRMAVVVCDGRHRRLPARMLTRLESNECMLAENRRGTALLVTASAPLAETTKDAGGPVG